MNVIILATGFGKRFQDADFPEPKPLINILGKYMIFYVIDTLKLSSDDSLFIFYRYGLDNYNFKDIVQLSRPDINFVRLENDTIGPPEALSIGMNHINNIERKTVVIDCDVFFSKQIDILDIYRKLQHNALFYVINSDREPIYSYLVVESKAPADNDYIIDIKEKIKISDNVNVGCYCFSSGVLLKKYCDVYRQSLYLSDVVKHLLDDGYLFHANLIDSKDYYCLGTPQQVTKFRDNFFVTDIHDNNFVINNNTIIKTGSPQIIKGEIYWYLNIPQNIQHLFPKMYNYDLDCGTYEIEKINGLTLAFMYVNELMTEELLLKYLDTLSLIHSCDVDNNQHIDIYSNYLDKINIRYTNYDYSIIGENIKIDKKYKALVKYFLKYQKNECGSLSVIHGDPVFGNVIYDSETFKFIDMRGLQGNVTTIYGDKWYDFGKVYQSLIGYYEILFNKKVSEIYKNKMITCFNNYIIQKHGKGSLNKIQMICDSLLFTLIPLHNNDKCKKYYDLIQNF